MGALGASGSGYVEVINGKEYHFSPYTQGMMDAFESWLVARVLNKAMETGELFRRKARKLFREAKRMKDANYDIDTNAISEDERSRLQEEWEDLAGEAQQLEFEAREMVTRTNERAAAGYYHFFGHLAREARSQIPGMEQIFYLSLKPKHPTITLADVVALGNGDKVWDQLKHGLAMANGELPKNESSSEASTPTQGTTNSESPSTNAAAPTETAGT